MKIKHPLAWLIALCVTAASVVAGNIFSDNIATFTSQHHLDNLIPLGIGWCDMFIHTWWGGFVLGLFVAAFVCFIWLAIAENLVSRDHRINPIEITFDSDNPNQHFWNERYVGQSDEYLSDTVTKFRLKIRNNTNSTIRGVEAKLIYNGGYAEKLKFIAAGSETCDLHPGASDFVTIYEYDEISEMQREDDDDYENPRTITIELSGVDVQTCSKKIQIDVSQTPLIKLLS